MHLLVAQKGSIADGDEAIDLGQSPGDVLFLTAADKGERKLHPAESVAILSSLLLDCQHVQCRLCGDSVIICASPSLVFIVPIVHKSCADRE